MSSCDIVVIGAGAAGLAATRTVAERGLSTICIEARDRIGGRAWTDSETFGVPFDRGCAWLHSADINPWRPIAAELGLTVIEQKQVWRGRLGDHWLGESEHADWDRVIASRLAAIAAVGASGSDVAASSVPTEGERWSPVAEAVVSWYTSANSDQVSTLDIFNANDTNIDWPIVEGYGALVARYGEGLLVSLTTPATRIAWGDRAVAVETGRGTVHARAAVIAVPTNVLASGAIRFDPPLPIAKQEAFHNIPLVLLRHKSFRCDRPAAGTAQHGHRGRVLTRAAISRRRRVAMEFGTWRAGRNGGASGSVTVGYGKFREERGGTRS